MNDMNRRLAAIIRTAIIATFVLALNGSSFSAAVVRQGTAPNSSLLEAIVAQFRADLGGGNNGDGGSFKTGRREINWDEVPDNLSAPNLFPVNFFNSNSPRGVIFSSHTTFGNGNAFIVSADSDNPTSTPVRFGNIDPSYSTIFQTFSAERMFVARNNNVTTVEFFIPGTRIPATVSGFGVIFADVDLNGPTYIKLYGVNGQLLASQTAPPANNGLSFVGISFNAGERVARIDIVSGNNILANGILDNGSSQDLVAIDDLIYGEPRARDYHPGDFDGDGFADAAIFRPSTATWFITNSGSNTTDIVQFGATGDIPLQGDFDGDKLADIGVFRPSEGGWYIRRSSNGTFITQAFGQNGDKPVPGDYDKDGITDIAVWRPSSGTYFVLRSSDNRMSFYGFPFGTNGDIPVLASPQ